VGGKVIQSEEKISSRRRALFMISPFEHVIVLMLENRSFDHLLAYSGIAGLQGVDTHKSNPSIPTHANPYPTPVWLNSGATDRVGDPHHEFGDVHRQIYGSLWGTPCGPPMMNGFVQSSGAVAMGCAAPSLIPNFISLARTYAVCDNWFSSVPGPTWPNRFFVHCGSSGGLAGSPSALTSISSMLWSKVGFHFPQGTLYDRLTLASKTWRVYHGDHFPQVCSIDSMPSVFVADSKKFRSYNRFISDIRQGDVANYTFIEPDYSILTQFRDGNSQHPQATLSQGDNLIGAVANAIIQTKPLFDKTLLVVTYDEHGGFYDQLHPLACTPPGDGSANQDKSGERIVPPFGFDQLGVRVPTLLISTRLAQDPYHELYDHTSVIKTVFENFNLPGYLTARDRDAKSLCPLFSSPGAVVVPPAPSLTVSAAGSGGGLTMQPPGPADQGNLHGFTRVAAQVHHALLRYQPGMTSEALQLGISAQDSLAILPELPETDDPNEELNYIRHVANLVQAHRQRVGEG
jgi:phospholipase C